MVSDVEWQAFFPAALLLAATPGANQLLTLRNGIRHGLRPAVSASAGRFTAFALMVAAVAAGLGAVLTASEVAFNIIKWCGVAYLAWLGGRTVLASLGKGGGALRQGDGPAGHGQESGRVASGTPGTRRDRGAADSWKLARQEFIVAVSNPKALILFTVFLPQFLAEGAAHIAVPLLLLGAAYIGVEFCCACGYAAVGGRLKSLGISRTTRRLLDASTGLAMLGLAGWLATEDG